MATKKNINASWNFTKDAVSVAEGTSVLSQGNWETLDRLTHGMVMTDRTVVTITIVERAIMQRV